MAFYIPDSGETFFSGMYDDDDDDDDDDESVGEHWCFLMFPLNVDLFPSNKDSFKGSTNPTPQTVVQPRSFVELHPRNLTCRPQMAILFERGHLLQTIDAFAWHVGHNSYPWVITPQDLKSRAEESLKIQTTWNKHKPSFWVFMLVFGGVYSMAGEKWVLFGYHSGTNFDQSRFWQPGKLNLPCKVTGEK